MNKEQKYYSEAHKRNSEGARAYIAKSKKQPLSLQEALKQQERNSKDRLPDTK